MKTSHPKPSAPSWILIDADGQSLGRIAARIAHILRGKHKASFVPNQVCGDHIVVINADKLKFTQRKLLQKRYYKHSGYLGHLKSRTLGQMMEEKPVEVIELAVKRMLPANRLRPQMLKQLHVFAGAEHTYQAQKPEPLTITSN